MTLQEKAADALRGTACAGCTVLFAAAAFAGRNVLITLLAAAVTLDLCIRLLRTPDRSARKRRSLISLLMFLPLLGICTLLGLPDFLAEAVGADFADLCALIVFYLPGACILLAVASVYAGKQKAHPVLPLVILYLLYAVRLADAFSFLFRDKLPSDLHMYSGFVRELFFEVCALAALHLILLLVLSRICRNGSTHPKRLKGFSAAVCGYTVFAAAASCAELYIYIRAGGPTPLRNCAAGITIGIAAVCLVLLLYQLAGHSGQTVPVRRAAADASPGTERSPSGILH